MYEKKQIIMAILVTLILSAVSLAQTVFNSNSHTQLIPLSINKSTSQNWNWKFAGSPINNTQIEGILVDEDNENIWYVASIDSGLFITRDGGISWEHPLNGRGLDIEGYQIDPNNSSRILVTIWDKVFISNDKGLTWLNTYTCPEYIRSILISKIDGSIYLGPQTTTNNNPGVYKSTDGGVTFTHLPFGVSTNYIICWDIEEDIKNNILYVSTELADHPKPYNPPLFRSFDSGATWNDVSNTLNHHSLKLQVDTSNSIIYFLEEAGSLYKSADFGNTWEYLNTSFLMRLFLDQQNPSYIFGGRLLDIEQGGAFFSSDGGKTFTNIGLSGNDVSTLITNSNSTKVYAVSYGSGIYVADIPLNPTSNLLVTNTNDSGIGSLREAIKESNSRQGTDTIKFRIPKSDPNFDAVKGIWTIQPESTFADIIDSGLVIEGTSQSSFIGYDTNPEGPEIVIDGSIAEPYAIGISIQNNHTEIYGLTINHFGGNGIYFYNCQGGIVAGCYIGTNYSGMSAAGNGNGIIIANNSNHVWIGPSNFLERSNVISGNKQNGIFIVGSSKFNTVLGNYIGVNKNITDTISNESSGIFLFDSSDDNKIFGNSIGGCTDGISISQSNNNSIKSNIIGASEPSGYYLYNMAGINIFNNSKSNEVIENTISFNHGNGIGISGVNSTQNRISHNFISNNWGYGIDNSDGGNTELAPPIITSISDNKITGTGSANQIIEIFADSTDEGHQFIDSTITDASGNFSLTISSLPNLPNITATARDIHGNTSEFSTPFIVTDINKENEKIPSEYALYQNYPNPFNPTTIIRYSIPHNSGKLSGVQESLIELNVYDLLGNELATLLNANQQEGDYSVVFDGSKLSSGVYYYQIKIAEFIQTKKMILLK